MFREHCFSNVFYSQLRHRLSPCVNNGKIPNDSNNIIYLSLDDGRDKKSLKCFHLRFL